MDGVTPAVVPPEENALVLHADINEPVRSNTLHEELKNVNDLPTCTLLKHPNTSPMSLSMSSCNQLMLISMTMSSKLWHQLAKSKKTMR
uniref:Uncharacterized protein n=1 Tax=Anopheles merus TaxID=30066 RepID=A0A182VB98_ANOME